MRHGAQHGRIALNQLLQRHWVTLLQETSMSEFSFAASVREIYESNVRESSRSIEWSTHPDTYQRGKRDAERLHRWFSSDSNVRFPVEILEAFIAAFPPDRRDDLAAELINRLGYLPVRMPASSHSAGSLGRVLVETGQAVAACGELYGDGALNEHDRARAPDTLLQIEQAIAALVEVHAQVKSVLK